MSFVFRVYLDFLKTSMNAKEKIMRYLYWLQKVTLFKDLRLA